MDLTTSSGWLSSYSVEAILLQIRMAISNTDPRPARLHTTMWKYHCPRLSLCPFRVQSS